MKKENIYKILYVICILLIIGFGIRLIADYLKYDTVNNSAPFWVWIIRRIVEFIIPYIICFIIAKITRKKFEK